MYSADDVFRAFIRLHNENDNGDVYLPHDAELELMTDDSGEGFWVKNCNVWISIKQIREQLEQLEADQ